MEVSGAEPDAEVEEDVEDDADITTLGDAFRASSWDGSSNVRANRRPTREEKGGYIDNEELQDEVLFYLLWEPYAGHGQPCSGLCMGGAPV